MYDFRAHYQSLSRVDKILFKEKVMNQLGIDYLTFYSWLARNKITAPYREQFAQKILGQTSSEVFGTKEQI